MHKEVVFRRRLMAALTVGVLFSQSELYAAEKSFLLPPGATWSYYTGHDRLGANWAASPSDSLVTGEGASPLGYGYDDIATAIPERGDFALPFSAAPKGKYPAAYFARTFSVDRSSLPENQAAITVFVACDDGCVVFVNAREIGRVRLPEGDVANYGAEGVGKVTGYSALPVPVSLLRDGDNAIAVEVHQQHAESSDLKFDAAVTLANPAYLPY